MSSRSSPHHGRPIVTAFFEKRTFSVTWSPTRGRAARIIDPVLDFDPKSGATAMQSADQLLEHIDREGYTLEWILDTHPHADHFSAAGYLKDKTGVPTAIGEKVIEVQKLWKGLYNLPDSFPTDGSQWDRIFADGERFKIGNMDAEVLLTPGHTLASIAYVVGDAAFIHDTIFMPDGGLPERTFQAGAPRSFGQHPAHHGAARRDAPVHGARLHAGRPRASLGEHGRAAEGREHPPHESEDRGGVRGLAGEARPRARDAEADPALAPGEHPGRSTAGAREQRQTLSENPTRCA